MAVGSINFDLCLKYQVGRTVQVTLILPVRNLGAFAYLSLYLGDLVAVGFVILAPPSAITRFYCCFTLLFAW